VEAAYNLACLALTQEINGYDDELDDPNHFEGED